MCNLLSDENKNTPKNEFVGLVLTACAALRTMCVRDELVGCPYVAQRQGMSMHGHVQLWFL